VSIDVSRRFDGKLLARLMLRAVQTYVSGVRAVARAPALVLIIYIALVSVVLPSAAVVARSLDASFKQRTLERLDPGTVDDSWFERAPVKSNVMGFAAQLTNLDDLVAARMHDERVTAPLGAWFVAWTFLLGGVLQRLRSSTTATARSFIAACIRCWPPFAVIGVATLAVYAASAAAYATTPLAARPAVLVPLTLLVGVVTLVASYARAWVAIDGASLPTAVAFAARILRVQPLTVATHALIALAGWTVLLLALARLDVAYGAGTGFWRPLIVAQVYVGVRIVQRLVWEASVLALINARAAVSPR
jgi:hypothetical protein